VIKSLAVADRTVENFMREWNLMSHGNASDDDHFMAVAIAEAEKCDTRPGAGDVGCVIVRDGEVVVGTNGSLASGSGHLLYARAGFHFAKLAFSAKIEGRIKPRSSSSRWQDYIES
jgi:hypothetical protein